MSIDPDISTWVFIQLENTATVVKVSHVFQDACCLGCHKEIKRWKQISSYFTGLNPNFCHSQNQPRCPSTK